MDTQIALIFITYLEVNMKYRIISQISETVYYEILKIAFDESDYFSVCTFKYYHKKDLTNSYFDFFNEINMYQKDEYEFCLPKHYTKGQKFHVFELNKKTKEMLRNVNSFRGWIVPNSPEDLSFYNDKKVWLSSISHENLVFVETENSELIRSFMNLGLQLVEQ